MLPKNLSTKISDFSYNLPDDRIAKYPLQDRDASKLLVYKKGEIIDEKFTNCPNYLPEQSLVIFNDTRVIHARIIMQKATGARIEILCLEPNFPADYEQNFAQTNHCSWKCVVGNAKKWKDGVLTATIGNEEKIHFSAEKKEQTDDGFIIEFQWDNGQTFAEILETIGKIPIPPYLNRESEENDSVRYQTIFAERNGSVAAPTAGLHFTPHVIDSLTKHNIEIDKVTLHVGAGTFKPVKTEQYTDHVMHQELCIVKKSLVENILRHLPNITAVGTTSVRTLESLYWFGVKLCCKKTDLSTLTQWEAYELAQNISAQESLEAIVAYMGNNHLNEIQYHTQIMITPAYKFRLVQSMFTNFHQPQSTLLLLISAFIGDAWHSIYDHALANGYRFLSYGDSSLLMP